MSDSPKPESSLIFSIRNYHKAVPYPGSGLRDDGHENYGFKPLKGRSDEAALIAEVQDNESLKNALIELNDPSTLFFTIGCEKSCNPHNSTYWMRGFLEFAFNYTELVSDAQNYFKLFFDFTHLFWEQPTEAAVEYHFQLEGAGFLDADAAGFTAIVWITTLAMPSEEVTKKTWSQALDLLVKYLKSVPVNPALRGRMY